MATNHRIFISFAIEDERFRNFLVSQARDERSSFSFVDMSVKQAWDNAWKTNCRTKIKGCDGIIALVSKNTAKADGQLWEIACAKEEHVPIVAIYVERNNKPTSIPLQLNGVRIVEWSWLNISSFLNSL